MMYEVIDFYKNNKNNKFAPILSYILIVIQNQLRVKQIYCVGVIIIEMKIVNQIFHVDQRRY